MERAERRERESSKQGRKGDKPCVKLRIISEPTLVAIAYGLDKKGSGERIVKQLPVQIFVVVANIQMGALKSEVGKGSM